MKQGITIILLLLILCFVAPAYGEGANEIPLKNPSFDGGIELWNKSHEQYLFHDPEIGRTNPGSLKIDVEGRSLTSYVTQSVRNLERGSTYELRAWVRGTPGKNCRVALKIEWWNEAKKNTSGQYEYLETGGSGDWIQIKLRMIADVDTTWGKIYLRTFSKEPIWFDDVSFIKVADPPPFMLNTLAIGLKPEVAMEYPVDLLLFGSSKKLSLALIGDNGPIKEWIVDEPEVRLEPDGNNYYRWQVPFPPLKPGEYTLSLKLPEMDPDFQEKLYVTVPPDKRKPGNLTDDGTYLVDGLPFFPIGLYHAYSESGWPKWPTPLKEDYRAIYEKGFNSVQTKASTSTSYFTEVLGVAKESGLMLDVSLYPGGIVKENLESYKNIIIFHKGHPNVLTWKIIDEPDLRKEELKMEVPEAYREYKKLDADTPVLLTLAPGSEEKYSYWSNFCDVFQVDPYPIPGKPLTFVADHVARAKSLLEPWQNLTIVLQCGWKADPNYDNPKNQPTKDQARSMVYLSLINGAKGIFWYSYRDPGWNLPDSPLWKDFKEINQETAWLGNIVISGQPFDEIKCTDGEVQYASWKYEDRVYVFVTNSASYYNEVSITLPKGFVLEDQRYDKTVPNIEESILKDSLEPLASTVYVLKRL